MVGIESLLSLRLKLAYSILLRFFLALLVSLVLLDIFEPWDIEAACQPRALFIKWELSVCGVPDGNSSALFRSLWPE